MRRVPLSIACVIVLALCSTVVRAQTPPSFEQEVASARKAGVSCKDVAQVDTYSPKEKPKVVEACRAGRFRFEWVVCTLIRGDYCTQRYLTAPQRERLEKIIGAWRPVANTGLTTVDLIAVTEGKVTTEDAEIVTWLHDTIDTCARDKTVSRGTTAIVRVKVMKQGGASELVAVPNAKLRSCLAAQLAALSFKNLAEDAVLEARVRVTK